MSGQEQWWLTDSARCPFCQTFVSDPVEQTQRARAILADVIAVEVAAGRTPPEMWVERYRSTRAKAAREQ